MELLLNLVWALLAALMIGSWRRFSSRTGANRRNQLVALAVLLLILFPVISVTDDLQAVQNPAETDCCQRRSYLHAPVHPTLAAAANLPPAEFSGLHFLIQQMAVEDLDLPRVKARPELGSTWNRPPPTA